MRSHVRGTLNRYITDLGDLMPSPGGGSASALIGTLGTSELLMVCAYTLSSDKYAKHHQKIKTIDKQLETVRSKLTFLIDEDSCLYGEYVKTLEGKKNEKKIKRALRKITEVPLEISRLASLAGGMCHDVLKYGNPYLSSDVYCAYYALRCAFYSARVNVQINLRSKYTTHDKVKVNKWLAQKEKIFKKYDKKFTRFK